MLDVAICVLLSAAQPAPADLVIENARIWSDGLVGFAEFAAVRDGRFVHVGQPSRAWIGPDTKHVDAGGRVVLPGLIDTHVHMLGGGEQLLRLELRDATDRADFIRRVRDWADALPPDAWILGGRWSVESWTSPQQPTREWVDDITGGRPLYLPRMDGHSALVNTAALLRAGITKDGPPNPEGGFIDRDPRTGEPTGILRDQAMDLVSRHIPPLVLEDKVLALQRAATEALRHGITSVSDIPSIEDLPAYEKLAQRGSPVRFFVYLTADDWVEANATARRFQGRAGWVTIRGFKGYLDGSMGSRTAYMREPFLGNPSERPDWRGLLREGAEDGRFARNIAAAHALGAQPIVHAIGDEANHVLLNVYEQIYRDPEPYRCRAEHAQHLLPQDIARFGRLGVIASMQPYHKADDGRYAEAYIGPQRCRSSYTFKTLLDTGAVLVFGSDWPVVTLNPYLGLEAAVTGRTLDGKLWQTQENIPVAEALRSYTSRAAYAVFAENEIGRIARNYRADFVILNHSPFDAGVDWSAIAPVAVYVEGRRLYAPTEPGS
ncbi:MAG: amidohydrolase [Planctomycetota bacterium]|jgi:predicted amidohydrolase YtcJ